MGAIAVRGLRTRGVRDRAHGELLQKQGDRKSSSEVTLLLFLLHRGRRIMVDHAALTLGGG